MNFQDLWWRLYFNNDSEVILAEVVLDCHLLLLDHQALEDFVGDAAAQTWGFSHDTEHRSSLAGAYGGSSFHEAGMV